MKKTIFLVFLSVVLLFLLTCDLYNKSIPEYLDKYTNNAGVGEFSFTSGMLSSSIGQAYPGCIQQNTTIDLKLRNPKNYDLVTSLEYNKNSAWIPFSEEIIGDYRNKKNTATSEFPNTEIRVKFNPTDHIIINIDGEIGKTYNLKLKLSDKETGRDFETYELPKLICTDYPNEITNISVSTGSGGNGLKVKWEQALRGDLADADSLVISCPSLGVSEAYKRIFNGTTWGEWLPGTGAPAIIRAVPGGDNYSATIGSSVLLTSGVIYNVTLRFANEAGIVRETSKSLAADPYNTRVTIGGASTTYTSLDDAYAYINTQGASTATITILNDIDEQGTITIPAGREIILVSDSANTIELGSQGSLFNVTGTLRIGGATSGSLVLKGINNNNAALINVTGTLEINENTLITGNTNSGSGGGVYSSGTFNMNGGSIVNNTANNGGGVYVAGGTFSMGNGARVTVSGNNTVGANDVYLATANSSINITNGFGSETDDVARITPQSYAVAVPPRQLLSGTTTLVEDNYSRFVLTQVSGQQWSISEAGQLLRVITNAGVNVTSPVALATPAPNATTSGSFSANFAAGTVSWSPAGNFQAGTTYTATVTLTANTGYIFTGLAAEDTNINTEEAIITNNIGTAVTLSRTFEVEKNVPTGTWPAGLTATYGQTLSEVLPALTSFTALGTIPGTFTWTVPVTTSVGDASPPARLHNMTFTPADLVNYGILSEDVGITVNKATPTVTAWPTAATITYGVSLSTSELSGGAASVPGSFAWTTGATVPIVSNPGYQVTFTPADTSNYNTVLQNVSITVNKADPVVNWPTGLTAAYGQTLGNIALPGNGTSTPNGAFTWTAGTTLVGALGEQTHSMTFTPVDTGNYNGIVGNVIITVNMANPVVSWPTGLTATYGQTLAAVALPGNGTSTPNGTFTWTTGNATSVGNAGTQSHGITFTPNDATNYNIITGSVSITVSRATGSAVGTPTVSGTPTTNSITVNTVANPANGQTVEYNISTASNGTGLGTWQTGTTFSGLTASTTYYVYAHSAQNTNYNAGANSVSAGISTAAQVDLPGPVTVATEADLRNIGTGIGGWGMSTSYNLTANITLTSNWTPIGDDTKPFTGTFEGNGNAITGLTINESDSVNYRGLFGYTSGATIKRVRIVNCNITAGYNTGGVVGTAVNNSAVEFCSVSGTITGYNNVGGIVGSVQNSNIRNCVSTANITGSSWIGGVLGGYSGSDGGVNLVENCYSTGNIKGFSMVGGVIGDLTGTVRNCYSSGNLEATYTTVGDARVAGIVGISASSTTRIEYCVALNAIITAPTSVVARIYGYTSGAILTNNYARADMSLTEGTTYTPTPGPTTRDGADVSAGTGAGQYNTQAFWQNTMVWDFTTIWQMSTAVPPLPILQGIAGQ